MRSAVFIILTTIGLAGCGPSVEFIETKVISFASSNKAFRWGQSAFPMGSQFEIVQLVSGQRAVLVQSGRLPTAAGGFGGPVVAYSVPIREGFLLDTELCTTGQLVFDEPGFARIIDSPSKPVPGGLCFQIA